MYSLWRYILATLKYFPHSVQSKVAVFVPVLLVAAHGRAEPGQDLGQRLEVLIGEDEDGRLISLDCPEFHLGLVVASASCPRR